MSASVNHLTEVDPWVADLTSGHRPTRQRARKALATLGSPGVAALATLLTNPDQHLRWEAVTKLGEIGGPEVAPVLVNVLEHDPDGGIRWLAAQGLIHMKREGLVPLLLALTRHPSSIWLKEGAVYVLRSLARKAPELNEPLRPVLSALENAKLAIRLPLAAQAALDRLVEPAESTTVTAGMPEK